MEASKSHRVRDVLPSIKPSFLSVVLVFFVGVLWAKNEMTNERLTVLEEQMKKLTEARYVETGLITRHEGISPGNITYSKRSARKIQIPEMKRFYQSPVLRSEDKSRSRYRRHDVANTTRTLMIDQIRKEINTHFRNFTPLKYCRSNETVCPSGPPGLPGPQGTKGSRGRRGLQGKRGMTGPQGVMGPPGKHGKQGIMGPQGVMGPPGKHGKQGIMGPPGTQGEKGNPGPRGIAGPVGPPGESISVPRAVMSPTEQTRDEGSSVTFYCTAAGNPKPTVEWRFKGVKIHSGSKYSVKQDELGIRKLNYSDAGKYSCAAQSLLGSAEVSGNLSVRGVPVFIQIPPSLVTPIEGTNLQESCQAEGFPAPVLNWTRLIQPLPVGRTKVEKGNLTVRSLTAVDSGLYECVATNRMGTKRSRMNIAVQKKPVVVKDCDCWRSRSRSANNDWGYNSGNIDAIDFKADDDITLQGYRLWGVKKGSGSYDVTIRLYRGDSLIAEKTGSYRSSSTNQTYEAFFSQEISLRAGLVYTALARIQGSYSFALTDGITSTVCSGVRVTFMKSARDTNLSNVQRGQIPALIFRSSNC